MYIDPAGGQDRGANREAGMRLERVLSAIALLAVSGAAAGQQPAPQPACNSPAHRAFDFWIGEWRVYVTGTSDLAGLSTITREDAGCVITEHFRSQRSAYTGRSLNIYNAQAGRWEQFWVDSAGDITHFVGNPTPDGMQLTAEDDVGPGQPTPIFSRLTFTRNPDGSVRQHGQASADHGRTWVDRYDFTYRPAPKS